MAENKKSIWPKCRNLFLCLVMTCSLSAQDNQLADSLLQALQTAQADINKVNLLNDLAWELKFNKAKEAKNYLTGAIELSKTLAYPKGEAQAYNNRGVVEAIQGNVDEATNYLQKALKIRKELNDKKGVASLYNNIGNLFEEKGDFVSALENLKKSLSIREALKDTQRIANVKYNIGIVHEAMGNYPEALDYVFQYLEISQKLNDQYSILNAYNLIGNIKTELERFDEAHSNYQKALVICEKLEDESELAIVYNNLGNILDDLGEKNYKDDKFRVALPQFNEGLKFHQQSLALRIKMEDTDGQGASYNNLGVLHKNIGSYYLELEMQDSADSHFQEALAYFDQSLPIRKSAEDKKGIMEIYNGIGDVRRRQKKLDEALEYTNRYLELALDMDDQKFLQKAYKDLSKVYADLKKYKKAYKFRKKYDNLRYDRLDEDRVKQNSRREAIYGDVQKQFEIERQEKEIQLGNAELQQAATLRNSLIGGSILLILLAALLFSRNRTKHKTNLELAEKNKIIDKERLRSEELLLNILPSETAKELKENGKAPAQYYESVTVLFTDIQSFTQIAEQLTPEALVAALDECFRSFDKITTKFNIEKIKTIGDAYMCAGGLPISNQTHSQDVIKAAFEMQLFMDNFNIRNQKTGLPPFRIRIGIHTGPVVAGIVGNKKFAYDIWGDTVNLAARMESGGEPGKINISRSTYELVKNDFTCIPRGKISVKNKGEVEMFFAEAPILIKSN